ncbi:MAG TPA: hypothetical protein VIL49_15650 [Capillimicrobium sp.]|jgi:hypothetical protein
MRKALQPRVALPAIVVLLFVVVALASWLPWATVDRRATTATPTPPAFEEITPVVLRPGEQACVSEVAFSTETRAASVLSAGKQVDGPPLRVEARAEGWTATGEIEGGYDRYTGLQATLEPPPRDVLGELCVTNAGDRAAELQGSAEPRVTTRSETTVEGEPSPSRMTLLLTEGVDRSLADRPGQILQRIAAFKPPIVGSWSLSLLALLVVLGVPAAVLVAVKRGIADEA